MPTLLPLLPAARVGAGPEAAGLRLCPHCKDGGLIGDAWEWGSFKHLKDWPEVPDRNVVYDPYENPE